MQINPVNPTTEYNLPTRAGSEKNETAPPVKTENKSVKETPDQIEVKDVSPTTTAVPVEANTSLKFSRDQQTNELIVELVNTQTGESLRQTPSEVSLKLSAIYAGLHGKLVDKNY